MKKWNPSSCTPLYHFQRIMSEASVNNKRIAKNTMLLYIRMAFMMLVQLYTSRVVLSTLGVDDYGIYNVVGGIVAMFGFLNTAMTTSTQRYLTFELGKGNSQHLKQVFATSINIHIIVSIIVVILVETIGTWFLYNKMVIPNDRLPAAMWVLQLSVFTTVVAIMSYPYTAAIVAHERMSAFAYISLVEVTMKLLIVYLLAICRFDKLILYSILIALIQLGVRFCYSGYCSTKFHETKFHFYWNTKLMKEMLSFAGWNLLGNMASILYTQGLNMLLNVFFGPVVNAARALAVQVQGAIQQFSLNFQMALNPQITKSYANGNMKEMHILIYRSSKFTFLLLFCICFPVLLEAPLILKLWLNVVPEYTVTFLRLMVITMIIDATANPLMVSAQATGKVKAYQVIVGSILLAILPISYVVLKLGGAPWSVFLVHLILCCVAFVARLLIIRPLIQLDMYVYFKDVILRCIIVVSVSLFFVLPFSLCIFLQKTLLLSWVSLFVCISSGLIASFCCGLDIREREVVLFKVKSIINKL